MRAKPFQNGCNRSNPVIHSHIPECPYAVSPGLLSVSRIEPRPLRFIQYIEIRECPFVDERLDLSKGKFTPEAGRVMKQPLRLDHITNGGMPMFPADSVSQFGIVDGCHLFECIDHGFRQLLGS